MKRTYQVDLPNGFSRNMRDVGDFRDLVRQLPEDFDGTSHRAVGDWLEGMAVGLLFALSMLESQDRRLREIESVNARLLDEAQKAAS